MSPRSLDMLLEKLCSGDAAAAEQVFLAYEPYLRKVVRRQLPPRLRAKLDSIDVVQSVWADVLQGFRNAGWRFADAAHLRAFLVKVTRHRFIDRVRQHNAAVQREKSLAVIDPEKLPPAREPRPSEAPGGVPQVKKLAEQMIERWRWGERPLAEEYLERYPELRAQPEAAIELIYEEICLRREYGLASATADVLERFPKWRAQLQV